MPDDKKRGLGSASEETKERAAHEGGEARAEELGHEGYQKLGQKGGQAAQQSGHAHELTEEEKSKGGQHSGGNFKNDPQRASEAGKKGGSQ